MRWTLVLKGRSERSVLPCTLGESLPNLPLLHVMFQSFRSCKRERADLEAVCDDMFI